ncbi:MAG: kinE 9 [Firmicutes bacterium]|nr:kinE 9 [Bacillota bacterium]
MYSAEAHDNKLVYLAQEETYQDYFESTKSGIMFLDAALRVKNLNHEAEGIFGIDRSQVLGKRADVTFRRFGDKFLKIFAISEYDDFYSTNVKLRVKEQFSYIHVDSLKLRDAGGNVNGVIIIMQDVSAVRATIKQIQTTQMLMSLGELAAGIAHHVRTPLTTISGYLQVMLCRLEDDRYAVRREVLEMLLDEVSYINNVVKELILFAKPPIHKEANVNINRLLEDALRLTFKELGGEGIDIDKQLYEDLPAITIDANLMKQALVNIMQNALEAMPTFGVLSIRTWIHAELNMIAIAITDTGPGVPPQILPRVFEPFYTTKLERMGLGLPTAHRIVHEHSGFINISSDEKSGTKVHIYLPVIDARLRNVSVIHQQILNLQ